jgi:tubulin---tyrosine ligase
MSDRGMGIRLFSSKESLRSIFEEFEEQDSDEEQEGNGRHDTSIITSQLRHFVIQVSYTNSNSLPRRD